MSFFFSFQYLFDFFVDRLDTICVNDRMQRAPQERPAVRSHRMRPRTDAPLGLGAMDLKNESLLVRNARVLTLDENDREWPRADIAIENGRIQAIGPDAGAHWPRPFARTIDASGLLAMPGLINAHFHSPGNLMKGSLPGYQLEVFI